MLKVYEYLIKDKKVGNYYGSYTIPENCPQEKELQKHYNSHLVDSYEN